MMNPGVMLILLLHLNKILAIPAIEVNLRKQPFMVATSKVEMITDFAVLEGGTSLTKLPPSFTICSSISSAAFTSAIGPFQLMRENGQPWITVIIFVPEKDATAHFVTTLVSQQLGICLLLSLSMP